MKLILARLTLLLPTRGVMAQITHLPKAAGSPRLSNIPTAAVISVSNAQIYAGMLSQVQ
jgi:hypothetical protein